MKSTEADPALDAGLAAAAWRDLEIAANATGRLEATMVHLPIDKVRALVAERSALPGHAADEGESLQARVQPWMMACFGPEIAADKLERSDRFIEEALELVQAGGYPKERVFALVEYVYDRPQGDINQEVGGVMITLAAHCLAHGVDMHEAGEAELARIWTKVDKIRAKQAAKPTGSALPIARPAPAPQGEDAELIARLRAALAVKDKALEPFATYAVSNGFGVNFSGEPIPDGEGVGWIYLTYGDFRAARAARQAGGDHER